MGSLPIWLYSSWCILTPAVSVFSAAEGLAVVKPELNSDIVPIAIAILIGLVVVQSFGIKTLSIAFSPSVAFWLAFLFITGAVNIASHPGIWRACDSSRAVLYFVRTKNYDALGGVVLAITGTEALFGKCWNEQIRWKMLASSDITVECVDKIENGLKFWQSPLPLSFSRRSACLGMLQKGASQLPLFVIVYPSLMLAYLGQGAKLIIGKDKVLPNIFYLSIPGGSGSPTYWIGFVLGILATIIASQAMLSASFSIVSQLSHLRSFPSVGMKHTDEAQIGQIYIPVVNYALGIAIVGVVAGFKTSTGLASAYGLAVISVAFITTVSETQ